LVNTPESPEWIFFSLQAHGKGPTPVKALREVSAWGPTRRFADAPELVCFDPSQRNCAIYPPRGEVSGYEEVRRTTLQRTTTRSPFYFLDIEMSEVAAAWGGYHLKSFFCKEVRGFFMAAPSSSTEFNCQEAVNGGKHRKLPGGGGSMVSGLARWRKRPFFE